MIIIDWLPEAKADLERLYNYISEHNPRAAAKAVEAIVLGVDQLIGFPEIGRPWEHDLSFRELVIPFGARSYIVRYRLLGESVVIVRVWHGLEERGG